MTQDNGVALRLHLDGTTTGRDMLGRTLFSGACLPHGSMGLGDPLPAGVGS